LTTLYMEYSTSIGNNSKSNSTALLDYVTLIYACSKN
jgi:hypothetical protein